MAMQESDVLIAVDVSGSTGGSAFYYDLVKQIVEAEAPHAKYIVWDDVAKSVSLAHLDGIIARRQGGGGTYLSKLAQQLAEATFSGHLHVITDGQVGHDDVLKADELLQGASYASVNIHIVNIHRYYGAANLSVAAPFIRASPFQVHTHDSNPAAAPKAPVSGDARGTVELEGIHSIADFMDAYDGLHAKIMAKNLGRSDLALKNGLLSLRTRLLKELQKWNDASHWGVDAIADALQARRYDEAKEGLLDIVRRYDAGADGAEFNARIERLVNLCTSERNYDLSLLERTSILMRTDAATEADPEAPPAEQESFGHECPVLMDASLPVLLVAAPDTPLLEGLDKKVLDEIAGCPLAVLKHEGVVQGLVAALDSVVGHDFYRGAFVERAQERVSPFSRRPLIGGVFLGNDASSMAATHWTLAHLTTGGKLLGNPHLWYLLLWHLVRTSDRWKGEEALLANMDAQLKHRAVNGHCKMALSGLPAYVQVSVPLQVALWYCTKSTDWFSDTTIANDRMRELFPVAPCILACLETLGLDYDASYTQRRLAHLGLLSLLMRKKEHLKAYADAVRAQHQHHLWLPGSKGVVFLDGPVQAEGAMALPRELARYELPLGEVLGLLQLAQAHEFAKVGAVVVPREPAVAVPEPVVNYNAEENDEASQAACHVAVCPGTLRPYYQLPDGKQWLEHSEAAFGPLEGQMPLHALYARFVIEQGAFPEMETERFVAWCAQKQAGKGQGAKDTLPASFEVVMADVFKGYGAAYGARWPGVELAAVVKVAEVAAVMLQSLPVVRRVAMEAKWKEGRWVKGGVLHGEE